VCYSGMKEHLTSLVSAMKLAVPTETAYAVLEVYTQSEDVGKAWE